MGMVRMVKDDLYRRIEELNGGCLIGFYSGLLSSSVPRKPSAGKMLLSDPSPRPVSVLSIGAGHASPEEIKDPDLGKNNQVLPKYVVDAMKRVVADCEGTAEELSKRYGEHNPGFFYRFSVGQGAQDISLKEWKKMDVLNSRTRAYMRTSRGSREIDHLM